MSGKWRSFARWRLRGCLARLPARAAPPASVAPRRIAYLFSGGYGDFAQALPALRALALAYPAARIACLCPPVFLREFAPELPPGLRHLSPMVLLAALIRPFDLLATNAVGVYRSRFDVYARFLARRALGFRHRGEPERRAFHHSLELAGYRDYAAANLRLLAGLVPSAPPAAPTVPSAGGILFHVGSAGFRRAAGDAAYLRLVEEGVERLRARGLALALAPSEADWAETLSRRFPELPQVRLGVEGLIAFLRAYRGRVLCFDSFMTHLCRYLGQPATVIHRLRVPEGYDCAPLHAQVVWDGAWPFPWEAVEAGLYGPGSAGARPSGEAA